MRTESNKRPHAHKLQTWADVAKVTGHLDPLGLDPRLLYDTSAALWKAGYRSLGGGSEGYLSAVRQELVLRHGTLPEAFGVHFRRVKRAPARGRGRPQQASALPFLRVTKPPLVPNGRVTRGGCSRWRL